MKKHFLLSSISLVTILLSISCSMSKDSSANQKTCQQPTNIILMIGDGMSTPQVYAAMLTSENPTSFERFPFTGLAKTYSKSHKITDSAAGGTAIATGHKTNNGMIGMDSDSIPVPSVLEILSEKGMKTGVIATSYITHATPASFVAKNINRNNYEEIAMNFAKSNKVDLLIGGGRKHFNQRQDGVNLIEQMVSEGWNYYDTLINIKESDKTMILASEGHLPSYPSRGNFLPDATVLALEKLSGSENGFFLMIEGSQIDFAAHNCDSTYLVNELHDFDNTINKVLDFAEKDGNTLVIVTADHETGGLTMIDTNGRYTETFFKFSTGSHSPLMVPVFAFGPGSENFTGIMENTDIVKKIYQLLECNHN
ncbi:MAG: alkaline phosphatase [Bacteroidales bacterium]|nr:alkaline phosphatase [Bacteroidales bacterium]